MNKQTEEYHSGDKSLMGKKLTQVIGSKLWRRCEELDFAIKQLEKYKTAWLVKSRKAKDDYGRPKMEYALFRAKIERVV